MIALPQRKILRLKGFDYSESGLYYITACTEGRRKLFGSIQGNIACLSTEGNIVKKWWEMIPLHFSTVMLDAYIIMPNHIHGIIQISNQVGAGLSRPMDVGLSRPMDVGLSRLDGGSPHPTISKIMGYFKYQSTKEINLKSNGPNNTTNYGPDDPAVKKSMPCDGPDDPAPTYKNNDVFTKIWQRSYYDHIIRDEEDYHRIVKYIEDNPKNWETDEENRN